MNETRLDGSIDNCVIKIEGYNLIRKDGSREGGGVATDSSTVPKYPQVSLVKILGVGCYFRDCEIRTRKVANSLENLQMCSKSCKYALNVCKYA